MKHKVLVTERALVQRINRALASEGEKILKLRIDKAYCLVGKRTVLKTDVDLEKLGRNLAVLKPYEEVV